MAKRATQQSPRKLFEEKELLIKEHPDLNKSFKQFLRDLEDYRRVRLSMKQAQEANDYLIFGASFRK